MITLGIDLSSMPEGTAACRIRWTKNGALAEEPTVNCNDDRLDALLSPGATADRPDAIGIDAPFGWPEAFAAAVANWTIGLWNEEERDRLRFRETDFEVSRRIPWSPLSVSSDRIALPAMRAMALLRRHKVKDRSGDGRFFEVYPAGSLFCWKLRCRGYKRIDAECLGFRKEILTKLRRKLSWLDVPMSYAESSDTLDALIASLTARVAKEGLTAKPGSGQKAAARREGWIHLPTALPRL